MLVYETESWVGACREEEASFSRTLQKGIERFKKAAANSGSGSFSGKDAFELYDTYGFPMDLTEVLPPQTVYAQALQCKVLSVYQLYIWFKLLEFCRPSTFHPHSRWSCCMLGGLGTPGFLLLEGHTKQAPQSP